MARLKTFVPLRFDRVEVCGRPIPSEESINLIWNEIENDCDKIQFVKTNNIIVKLVENVDSENYDDIAIRELIKKLNKNYQKQHKLLERNNFELFWQSLAVVNYFALMVAKTKECNTQALRKNESKLEKLFKNDKIPQKVISPRYTDQKRFPEYKDASDFLTKWYENILSLWKNDLQIQESMIVEFQIRTEIFKTLERSKNPYLNICQFCKNYFLTDRGGGHKSCGSVECERRYSAGTSKNSRSSPSHAKSSNPCYPRV